MDGLCAGEGERAGLGVASKTSGLGEGANDWKGGSFDKSRRGTRTRKGSSVFALWMRDRVFKISSAFWYRFSGFFCRHLWQMRRRVKPGRPPDKARMVFPRA